MFFLENIMAINKNMVIETPNILIHGKAVKNKNNFNNLFIYLFCL